MGIPLKSCQTSLKTLPPQVNNFIESILICLIQFLNSLQSCAFGNSLSFIKLHVKLEFKCDNFSSFNDSEDFEKNNFIECYKPAFWIFIQPKCVFMFICVCFISLRVSSNCDFCHWAQVRFPSSNIFHYVHLYQLKCVVFLFLKNNVKKNYLYKTVNGLHK